jgi:hypothetical protein
MALEQNERLTQHYANSVNFGPGLCLGSPEGQMAREPLKSHKARNENG